MTLRTIPLFAALALVASFVVLVPSASATSSICDVTNLTLCDAVRDCIAGLEANPVQLCVNVTIGCSPLLGCCGPSSTISCYVSAGACGSPGTGVTLFPSGTASTGACVRTCGTGAGYNLHVGTATSSECVAACTLPSVGVVVSGTPFCVSGTPPTVVSCGIYTYTSTTTPVYPGQVGVVLDYGPAGFTAGDGDTAFCVGPGCPAATPYGLIVDNVPHCAGVPTLCSLPGPGWTVGVGTTCVGAPWVGTTPALPGNPPSSCPGGTTIGITVIWGTTPVFGGPNYNVFCF